MVELVLTTGAIRCAKLGQITTNSKPTPNVLQVGSPSWRPTNSVKALQRKISHSKDLLTPSSPGGLPTLSLTIKGSWLPWGRVAMFLISPLTSVPLLSLWPITATKSVHHNSVAVNIRSVSCSPRKHGWGTHFPVSGRWDPRYLFSYLFYTPCPQKGKPKVFWLQF